MTITINGTTGIAGVDGSASTPAVQGADPNTGIFYPAADTIAFAEGGAEVARFDSSGNLGIGTSSPQAKFQVVGAANIQSGSRDAGGLGSSLTVGADANTTTLTNNTRKIGFVTVPHYTNATGKLFLIAGDADTSTNSIFIGGGYTGYTAATQVAFYTGATSTTTVGTERARIDSSGNFLVGNTTADVGDAGCELRASGLGGFTRSADVCLEVNRLVDDGTLVNFRQASTVEGSISVSGSTVSYNGGHLSRWAQMPGTKDDTLVKGTVMSNLDEMNVYTKDGEPIANEQLNKVKVSDVEGDVNVAGVFVNWTYDEAHQVDEINMAMTGDMIIRIAQGVVVQKGDLLMSAGDGTAKPQDDDIVRSKTVAKVTSNHVTCTYADGSYCVPCVLMAC